MRALNFELTTVFQYANGATGTQIECNFIELREPTGKVSHIACAIEGMIQTALIKAADLLDIDTVDRAKEDAAVKKNDQEDSDIKDGEGIYAVVASSGVDMTKFVLHFRELFKEVAWMGGEKKITASRLDDMSHSDLRKMIGFYTANFILN